jgi:hypothetical protein
MTMSDAALRGQIGAYAQQARNDMRKMTSAARAKFLLSFIDEVDPQRELPEEERLRRAEAAKSVYFARLALRRSRAEGEANVEG